MTPEEPAYLIIEEGYYFGDVDFIHMNEQGEPDGRRHFSAKAKEDCDLLAIKREDLVKLDGEYDDILAELFKNAD